MLPGCSKDEQASVKSTDDVVAADVLVAEDVLPDDVSDTGSGSTSDVVADKDTEVVPEDGDSIVDSSTSEEIAAPELDTSIGPEDTSRPEACLNDDSCDDGNGCNGKESCDKSTGQCVSGQPISCDDGKPCNGVETCDETLGDCVSGQPVVCDDGKPCNGVESCNETTGECEQGQPVECDDGKPCNGMETCNEDSGLCTNGTPVICDDGKSCNGMESCDKGTGQCVAGTPLLCDDGKPCNGVELCDETVGGCVSGQPIICDDGKPCNGLESCNEMTGDCVPGKVVECDDGKPCNGTETCNEQSGLCVNGNPVVCTDGKPCNGLETCNPKTGKCESGVPVVCSDGKPCNGVETCNSKTGQCVSGKPIVCTDGNPCNGLETCNSKTGKCQSGKPVVCNDGKPCNGVETCNSKTGKCIAGKPIKCSAGCVGENTCDNKTGTCVSVPAVCPESPSACDESKSAFGPTSGVLTGTVSSGFRLEDTDTWATQNQRIDTLAKHSSVTEVGLKGVLGDLNRTGKSITTGLDCFNTGFKWNSGDNEVDYWWPQGVTGSADSTGKSLSSTYMGKRVMMVSWYHKANEDSSTSKYKGARLSVVDHTSSTPKYRLVLLAEPVKDADGKVNLKALASSKSSLHAGGIVWYKNYLYVADTSKGFRVFDLNRTLRVSTGKKNTIGYDSSSKAYHAFGYRYVVPQVGTYTKCGASCCARFSFVSLDSSTTPPSLLAGEYSKDEKNGRLHRWPLDSATGRLVQTDGTVQASEVLFSGMIKMQGALSYKGDYFISSSNGKFGIPFGFGTLYKGSLGKSFKSETYPYLPEDLYYVPGTDRLWTCTEYPESWKGATRYCFAYKMKDVLDGCP